MPRNRRFRDAALLAGLVLATPAAAQVGASVTLQSDYQFHGFTLTDRHPAATASLSWDHASGLYAGGLLAGEATDHDGAEFLGHVEYLGYAKRIRPSLSWDLGISNASLSSYASGAQNRFHYSEIYAGLSTDSLSFTVRYSPNYIRPGTTEAYLDLSGAIRPAQDWRLFAHAGLTVLLTRPAGATSPAEHYDLRVGAARAFGRCEVQLALTTAGPSGGAAYQARDRGALVAAITYAF